MAKTEVTQITVDGELFIKKDALAAPIGDVKIVVLQRGWVAVGRFSRDGEMCSLDDAATVRVWGTTKGLGEIAEGGPTSKTILDKCGHIDFHVMTSVLILNCREDKWASRL